MNASVCVAAYNGAHFIEEQLRSILGQIEADDEVIVGDDGSTDETVCIVRSIGDRRVRLIQNPRNLGHVRNFEALIREAQGSVIFLSDQDDRWDPSKYRVVMDRFNQSPDLNVIHHARVLMTESGEPYSVTKPIELWRVRHPLIAQLTKGYVYGCCLAFRSSIRASLLPFPREVYAHDHWIALLAARLGGFVHLEIPLTFYRIHSKNVTPKKPLPFARQLYLRALQICLLVRLECRLHRKSRF